MEADKMNLDTASAFAKMIDAMSANVPISDKEYIGEDGLLHCAICHKRTQTRIKIDFLGVDKIVHCICECKNREINEQVRLQKSNEQRGVCFSGKREMATWTFENDDRKNAKLSDAMQRYARDFKDYMREGKGLLLYGPVGTGKSYFAACIANRLIDEGYAVKMTNFAELINEIQSTYEGKQAIINGINRYPLVIIDDLGAERQSEFAQEIVFNLIDGRKRMGLPLIVTTNLTAEEIKKPQDVRYARIYDRVLEMCFPVEVAGTSRRRQHVKETFGDFKDRLGL